MYSNPIYKLIQLHSNQFTRTGTSLRIEEKVSEQQVPYFMAGLFQPTQNPINTLIIDDISYTINWTIPKKVRTHVSIFADFLTDSDPSKNKASYHLTLFLTTSENGQPAKLRVYFKDFNTITCIELKDQNDQIIPVKRTAFLGIIAQDILEKFLTTIRGLYDQTYEVNQSDYDSLVIELNEKSKTALAEPYQLLEITAYLAIIQKIIDRLQIRNTLSFKQHDGMQNFFMTLIENITDKLNRLNAAPAASVEEVDESESSAEEMEAKSASSTRKKKQKETAPKRKNSAHEKLIEINSQLRQLDLNQTMSPYKKMVRQHALLLAKLPLIENFDETLACLTRMGQLENQTNEAFKQLMMSKNGDYADMIHDLPAFIDIMPAVGRDLFVLAINNNRRVAVELLIKRGKNLDLNFRQTGKMSLLEFAYHKKNIYIFKLLLKYGASPNIKCKASKEGEEELTLLMRACEDNRTEEIIALLEAGATDRIADTKSVTAFGRLIKLPPDKRSVNTLTSFMRHCQSMDVNAICCKMDIVGAQFVGTPLMYCCFIGWNEAADFLLEMGAKPVIRVNAGNMQSENTSALFCIKTGNVSLLSKMIYFANQFSEATYTELTKFLNSVFCKDLPKPVKTELQLTLDFYHDQIVNPVQDKPSPISPLCNAVRSGNTEETRVLLKKGESPNQSFPNGWPLLVWAANNKQEGIFQALISQPDCKLDCVTDSGLFPLFLATRWNNVRIVKLLLDHPRIDPNQNPDDRSPALVLAAYYGWTDIIRLLLSHRLTDPNLTDSGGVSTLSAAVQMDREDIVEILLADKRIDVNLLQHKTAGVTALHLAAAKGQTAIVNILLKAPNIKINLQCKLSRQTALYYAAAEGNLEVVIALLARPELEIDLPNDKGITPLMAAVIENHIEIVRVLLAANPAFKLNINRENIDGYTAFNIAAQFGRLEIVKLLLTVPGINTTKPNRRNGLSPLSAAILSEQDPSVVEKLVFLLLDRPDIKASVNQPSQTGETAFWLAAQTGNVNIINRMLNDLGMTVNINAVNEMGATPLFKAIQKNNTAAVKTILENKHYRVLVNKSDTEGTTPLHLAISNGNPEIVDALLAHPDLDVNQLDDKGYTPLQYAVFLGKADIVEKLLNHPNIQINAQGNLGVTPFFVAVNQFMQGLYPTIDIYQHLIKQPKLNVLHENTNIWKPNSKKITAIDLILLIRNQSMISDLNRYHPHALSTFASTAITSSLGIFSSQPAPGQSTTASNPKKGPQND